MKRHHQLNYESRQSKSVLCHHSMMLPEFAVGASRYGGNCECSEPSSKAGDTNLESGVLGESALNELHAVRH
jgi:hypothetical protein